MLGKLIKYEFKSTGKTFLPLYAAIILITFIQKVFGGTNAGLHGLNRLDEFAMIVEVGLFIGLGVLTILTIIQRFQKNLLLDEGYLTFTLPVKIREILLSKMIVAITWFVISMVVGLISVMVLFWGPREWGTFQTVLSEGFSTAAGRERCLINIYYAMIIFLIYVQFILTVYFALAIAQLPKLNKYRTGSSFIAFLVMGIIGGAITLSRASFIPFEMNSINLMFIDQIVVVVLIVVLFEIVHYILKRNLNLE